MKTNLQVSIIFLLIASSLLSACESAKADTGEVARSDLRRDTAPAIPAADAQTLLDGNNAFAFDFYRQVRGDGGNLVYSPYSISLAAAMLYGGAGGETASQIAGSLHFALPPDQFHPALNALSLDLAQRPAQSQKIDRKNPMQLYIANAVWGQRDYPFEKAYLDLLAVNYGAGVRLLDFAAAPDSARQKINDWVDRETQGKIKDVMPPGSVDPRTRMVLANAIYFKAAWQEAFVAKLTSDAPFTLLDGSQVQVPTMQTDGEIPLRVGSGEGYQVVALPYKGNLAEMVIILPEQGRFESVESTLDAAQFAAILDGLHPSSLTLYMPKFEFSVDFDLIPVLSALGMPLAFDEFKADFSGITKSERLYVYQALHKAYILVNEAGTEAAAATILLARPASLPQELRIDRPFIFIIRDVPTGTILFVGRVLNPLDK
jgi:serpin B